MHAGQGDVCNATGIEQNNYERIYKELKVATEVKAMKTNFLYPSAFSIRRMKMEITGLNDGQKI